MKRLILIMACLVIAAALFAGGKQEPAADAGGMDDLDYVTVVGCGHSLA